MDITLNQSATEKWNAFAEDDAFGYIMTDLVGADPQVFWTSGAKTVEQELLPVIRKLGINPDTGLEIGCGVGRLVFPLCSVFHNMLGLDISEGMTRRAERFAYERGITNVQFITIADPQELSSALSNLSRRVTFIYSLLVFQHISDFEVIRSYFALLRQLLSCDGIAYLQFDTRTPNLAYQVKTVVPDFLLPRFWRRGIRRIRRKPFEIERALIQNGLKIIDEKTPRSAYHRYVVKLV